MNENRVIRNGIEYLEEKIQENLILNDSNNENNS